MTSLLQVSQLQNKLQWSESQLSTSQNTRDELQSQVTQSTEELKTQKELLNTARARQDELSREVEESQGKLEQLQVHKKKYWSLNKGFSI